MKFFLFMFGVFAAMALADYLALNFSGFIATGFFITLFAMFVLAIRKLISLDR